ncbi:hypothetical protein GNP92_08030 [Paenibacillus timonensis]|nr:hypothetical protein [Paenibacillus timonensis]MUG86305.1 hypothetical protein [Paenibacillus timonensis]
MPIQNQDQERIETDGDPRTIYEDTTPHTRSGFMPEQPDVTAYDPDNEEAEQDQT